MDVTDTISDYVNHAKKRGDCIERVMELYDNGDGGQTHEPKKAKGEKKNVQNEDKDCSGGWCYRATAVCVLLLCVLLLSAVTFLWIKYNTLTAENNRIQSRYNNLHKEADQLQTSYNKMKHELHQFQFQTDSLRFHKDQLQRLLSGLESTLLKLGWIFFNSSIYIFTTEKKSWTESRKYCTEREADLVIINSREKQEFISKHFGSYQSWIGLTDTAIEGTFEWVDGTPLITEFWWINEPNDYKPGEDCVITGFTKAYTSLDTWADFPCDFKLFGICEMKIFNEQNVSVSMK